MRNLSIAALLDSYRQRTLQPSDLIEELLPQIAADEHCTWITRLEPERLRAMARALDERDPNTLPLYGIPFAIKDNIDLADVPTTAACPDFAYRPTQSAFVVERLIQAGAIPLGKTNLDQFAAGLSGTRSPYGVCRNSFDRDYISGGSSSGSAVAVATGQVSFALGTDTAGSGRVPAAFNNLVGVKPSCGRLSTRGVFPACRSLDCVSIFALTVDDAAHVLGSAEGYDASDAYSRSFAPASYRNSESIAPFTFGIPSERDLEFFGDAQQARAFEDSVRMLERLGGIRVDIDFQPFFAAAKLLYEGPWLAERYAALGEFLATHAHSLHPVTRAVIANGNNFSAVECFQGQYQLAELRRITNAVWSRVDFLVTPTAGTIYRIEQMLADPITLNSNLGRYTNFMNLLDLSALAVPVTFRSDGLPFGITLIGQSGADSELLSWAGHLHRAHALPLGATGMKTISNNVLKNDLLPGDDAHIKIVVCGAHMRGLALNHELTERRAILLERTTTAASYRLYSLKGGKRPGLVRVAQDGVAIEIEIWSMPTAAFASFVKNIPAPLAIGKVETDSGEWVPGFVCEGHATVAASDITSYGGWRGYLAADAISQPSDV